ncbi:hypothetical protein SKAU_G00233460 [Synaphobranchus kaupii]|uniref:Uncharacterized protein n=1 Tax=Synaphobranchus kaupii TaxID=118154 RepID=A0A9Q1F6B8_SYNKA|nr:hypothetical protein SKAU_G00233460 [Synaphobranchus kaupii]
MKADYSVCLCWALPYPGLMEAGRWGPCHAPESHALGRGPAADLSLCRGLRGLLRGGPGPCGTINIHERGGEWGVPAPGPATHCCNHRKSAVAARREPPSAPRISLPSPRKTPLGSCEAAAVWAGRTQGKGRDRYERRQQKCEIKPSPSHRLGLGGR